MTPLLWLFATEAGGLLPCVVCPQGNEWQRYAAEHARVCFREEKQQCQRPIARTMLGVSCVQPK
jgi:hypothetical protein